MPAYCLKRRTIVASMLGCLATGALRPAFAGSEIGSAAAAVSHAQFVAIGERHDNPDHHRIQAQLIAALGPTGIAFEMIDPKQAELVNALRQDGVASEQIGPEIGWSERGWPDWAFYAPILDAAADAVIYGAALSKSELKAIYADGASGLPDFPVSVYGLDRPLPETELADMLETQFAAHCEMIPREQLSAMVEVQRAWDARYAETLRQAGQYGIGVLICGNEHARLDRGAPAYLQLAEPDANIASVGLLEDGDEIPDEGLFTVTLSAPPAERDDPCEDMRKAMEKG